MERLNTILGARVDTRESISGDESIKGMRKRSSENSGEEKKKRKKRKEEEKTEKERVCATHETSRGPLFPVLLKYIYRQYALTRKYACEYMHILRCISATRP